MNVWLKLFLLVITTSALLFGFVNAVPGAGPVSFERLHVFLFNLCAGGFLLLCHSGGGTVTRRSALFIAGALAFTASAALDLYPAAIGSALLLAVIVESERTRRFSFFPRDFFSGESSASDRFLHASLLCLSTAITISAAMMIVKTYTGFTLPPKLDIDIFFLGFSFPVSLVTMSVMFSFIGKPATRLERFLHDLSFWAVNAGVIVFFVFIVAGWEFAQAVISIALFASVVVIFILFLRGAPGIQRKSILASGMAMLVMSALTGIGYIAARHFDPSGPAGTVPRMVLAAHGYISLYGWNQTGMLVIMRHGDFPLRFRPWIFNSLHWIAVAVLAPLGESWMPAGLAAAFLYAFIFARAFFAGGSAAAHRA